MSATASDIRLILLGLIVAIFSATTLSAKEPTIVPNQSAQQIQKPASTATPVPLASSRPTIANPHWQADACKACHTKTPTKRSLNLRDNRSEKLCNRCHESISSHSYIHPVGMPVDRKMLARMPASFRQAIATEKGRLNCRTCHDLTMTCLPKRAKEKLTNPRFFRDGPYNSRTDICYLCHDAKQYQRLNPHDQLTKSGKIKKDTCLICHEDGTRLENAKQFEDVDFNEKSDLSKMCTGCHPYQPHPGGSFAVSGKGPPSHLVRPGKSFTERMAKQAKKNGIVLPLTPGSGEIFCGTCHNPHEKGVIKTAAAAKGAGSKRRLRMQQMCANCHDK